MPMADTATFPVRTIAECNALLTGPGARFEMEEKVIGGVSMRTYKNAPATLRDVMLNTINWGARELIVFQDERVTFAAHYRAVCLLAAKLRNDFGVKKGDRVAVIMRNYPQ